jgi:hypothetical protein
MERLEGDGTLLQLVARSISRGYGICRECPLQRECAEYIEDKTTRLYSNRSNSQFDL